MLVEQPRDEATCGGERGAIGDERGEEERGDAGGEEVVAVAVEGGRGVGGEDMLEDAEGGSDGERGREGREGGGEAAAAEAAEQGGEVAGSVRGWRLCQHTDELGGGVGGGGSRVIGGGGEVAVAVAAAAEEEERQTGRRFHGRLCD